MKWSFYLIFFCIPISFFGQHSDDLKLWYDEPSGDTWENALPLGNGRLGAMVYGNVDTEIFQLNEHTVWSGSPNRNDNTNALEALPKVRELIFNGKYKAAEKIAAIIESPTADYIIPDPFDKNVVEQVSQAIKDCIT